MKTKTFYQNLLLDVNTNKLSVIDLTREYNSLTGKSLKKFESRAKGEHRLRNALEDKINDMPDALINIPNTVIKTKKSKTGSMAAKFREMILAGKTRVETLNTIRKEFDLPADKDWYFQWNVNALKRAGKLEA